MLEKKEEKNIMRKSYKNMKAVGDGTCSFNSCSFNSPIYIFIYLCMPLLSWFSSPIQVEVFRRLCLPTYKRLSVCACCTSLPLGYYSYSCVHVQPAMQLAVATYVCPTLLHYNYIHLSAYLRTRNFKAKREKERGKEREREFWLIDIIRTVPFRKD